MAEKIALFVPNLFGGGAERAMLTLASGLARHTCVDLVLAHAAGPLMGEVSEEVRVVDLHSRRTALALVPLARYLRRERPRVLLTTLNHASIVALGSALLSRAGARVLVREANTFPADAHGAMRWILPVMYKFADGFVAVSEGVAEDLAGPLGIPQRKIRVIYNPVVSPLFSKMATEEVHHPWFESGEAPVILGAGRLSRQKDFPTLLRAFALARRERPLRLMILGEGPERRGLTELAAELGVAEDFALPGFLTNPFPYMRRARVFVLSSAWEGLPNVLIQAIALGTPVVATDCRSGPREICEGVAGARLVPVGSVREMAAAIAAALGSVRTAGRPASLKRFELDTAVRQLLEFAEMKPQPGVTVRDAAAPLEVG